MSGKKAKEQRRTVVAAASPGTKPPSPVLLYLRQYTTYLRAIGAASTAMGLGILFLPAFYWWFVALIYAGCALLALDLILEPLHPWIKAASFVAGGVILSALSLGVFFASAPLRPEFALSPGFAPGTQIAGMKWESNWAEFRMFLTNESDYDYDDLDLTVQLDVWVLAFGQKSEIRDVSITVEPPSREGAFRTPQGKVPLEPIGAKAPIRIRCPKLPKRSALEILFATAEVKSLLPPAIVEKATAREVRLKGDYRSRNHPYLIDFQHRLY